ncbi:MAG: phosphoglucosamine mutase [Gammaproteobacteria bacterium]|nr:phosphoglucosamine mutase [Gammaproteobacteria bacterium]
MGRKYFGTDGIRGRVGDGVMMPDFVLKLGWSIGRVLCSDDRNLVLIGKDTRISGYMFESALEAGLSAAGVNSRLLGPMPTPAVAYLTRTLRAAAGIVISASHNPYYDNGVKFFSADGKKLPDSVELEIENQLDQPLEVVSSDQLGKVERINDAAGRYIEFCKSTIPTRIKLNGLKIVVDCAHGATYHIAPNVFTELGAEVISIASEPDGLNINSACGATNPKALRMAVIEHHADLGVAIDGDGDRLIMVDHEGATVDGDELLYVIAQARKAENILHGGVVGTLMSNLGLEHALQKHGIEFKRAAVGDRYVMEMMQEHSWLLGGESSGHIICLDRTTTGDAIVAALQVLQILVTTGKSLQEIKSGMNKYPQTLINVPVESKLDINNAPNIQQAVKDAESDLADSGRVLLRPSGTEPLIRVMVEGVDAPKVKQLAQQIAKQIEATVSASC